MLALPPLLFLLFIHDIALNVSSSIRLVADDCLVYRETNTPEKCQLLQEDLEELAAWSLTWGMAFNVSNVTSSPSQTPPNTSRILVTQ